MNSQPDIVVYLAHGTFNRRKSGVAHWADPDGLLATAIRDRLPEDLRSRVIFEPFDWNGKNRFEERNKATDKLRAIMERPDDRSRLYIGHSHGGTVIADALVAAKKPNCAGVMTLATPFVARMVMPARHDRAWHVTRPSSRFGSPSAVP